MSKVKKISEIKKVIAHLRKKRKKIVFTNGCFDILHYGHVKYLQNCRSLGHALIVGVNSDSSVKKIKPKGRPVTGQKERAAIISALQCVDYVTIFNEITPEKIIKIIAPDILAKGADWRKKDIVGRSVVEKRGGRVVSVPFVKGFSTTRILKRIKNA